MSIKTTTKDQNLSEKDQKLCGVGRPNDCFALMMLLVGEIICGLIYHPATAKMAGKVLGREMIPKCCPRGFCNK